MPFPLPLDPKFRLEVVSLWLDDVFDRVEINDIDGANQSLSAAIRLYLSLPSGMGCQRIEERVAEGRVKLEHLQT